MLPILWSDNETSRCGPGGIADPDGAFRDPGAAPPVVEVSGWNVPTMSVPVAVESRTAALQERTH